MLTLVLGEDPLFASIVRPVSIANFKPNPDSALELSSPAIIDVFEERRQEDDFLLALVESACAAAEALGYSQQFISDLRSSAWRSAHRLLVKYASSVDRGAELDTLSKLLGAR